MFLDKEYRILVVDDAKDTQILLEFDLSSAGYQVSCCDNGNEALAILNTTSIDLILLDMYMPGLSGLETLSKIKAQSFSAVVPVIMLSASNDEDEVVAALELGAGDYVTKPYVAKVLLARMRTAIRLKEKTEQLEYLAKTDSLTGLNNRGSFFDLSSNAINQKNRAEQPLVVAMFDIDFFKNVNDNYGHDIGDEVLRSFSQGMTEVFRDYDILGRIGGEEFAVCLPNTNNEEALMACERLREFTEKQRVSITTENGEKKDISITVSVGFILAHNGLSVDQLLKEADSALYFAKANGRNQVIDAETITSSSQSDNITNNDNDNIIEMSNMPAEKVNGQVIMNFDGIDLQLGINNVLGDEELFKEILVMFYQDHHQDANKLQNALQTHDIDSAKHIAHTLKGVACSVGAIDLFEATKMLDCAINDNLPEKFEGLYSTFSPEFTKVMEGILLRLNVE